MNKSLRFFDGLDLQYTLEEQIQQIDGLMIFTLGVLPLDFVAYNQYHKQKMSCTQCSVSGIGLNWFLRLHESYTNDWSAFLCIGLQNITFRTKYCVLRTN